MRTAVRAQMGWSLWLLWVLANCVGFSLGAAVSEAATSAVVALRPGGGALFGAVFGIAQWLVVRRHLASSGRWLLATIGGWAVSGVVGFAMIRAGSDVEAMRQASGGVGFAASGVAQWLILRRQARLAGWWIVASIGGLVVSGIALMAFLGLIDGSAMEAAIQSMGQTLSGALLRAPFGAVNGALTGAVLVWLLRQPDAQPRKATSTVS